MGEKRRLAKGRGQPRGFLPARALHFSPALQLEALHSHTVLFPGTGKGPTGAPSMRARSNFLNFGVACVIYPVFFRFSLAVQF